MIVELCRLNRSFLAKIVFYPKNFYPLLLPSHNCIIITMFSFQGAAWILKIQWNLLFPRNFSQSLISVTKFKKWWARTRFPAGKPRRLQQSTGLLPRAAFRVHFGVLASRTHLSRSWLLFKPFIEVVGQNGLEPSTSRLSVVCSSQLSYWPISASLLIRYISLYPLNWITHWVTTPCTDLRTLQIRNLSYLRSP